MKQESKTKTVILSVVGLVFAALCVLLLPWLATRVGADSGSKAGAAAKSTADAVTAYEMDVNNLVAKSMLELEELPVNVYIPVPAKSYMLSEDTVIAPKPNPANFGTSTNAEDVIPAMEAAAALMGDEPFLFDPAVERLPGSKVRWYQDETIFSVTWKELINGRAAYSFSEIKIAHPSQFRRYFADNRFANPIQYTTSQMYAVVNAVTAMSGDFYKFRPTGTVVYNRTLYRLDPWNSLDICYVDTDGDLLFVKAGVLRSEEAVNQYVAEHDVLFSLAFGPVLIEDGVSVAPSTYLVGEIHDRYSRAAICQLGPCHYLLVTVNSEGGYTGLATIPSLTRALLDKGIQHAYTLDGGQTATIVTEGRVFNHVNYGAERQISDIIYFATAIPEDER